LVATERNALVGSSVTVMRGTSVGKTTRVGSDACSGTEVNWQAPRQQSIIVKKMMLICFMKALIFILPEAACV